MIGKVTIVIGGRSCDQSFHLDHTPSLPECGAQEACEMLDVWLLISRCVTKRSKMLLQVYLDSSCRTLNLLSQNLLGAFENTAFEPYGKPCALN